VSDADPPPPALFGATYVQCSKGKVEPSRSHEPSVSNGFCQAQRASQTHGASDWGAPVDRQRSWERVGSMDDIPIWRLGLGSTILLAGGRWSCKPVNRVTAPAPCRGDRLWSPNFERTYQYSCPAHRVD